MEPALTRGDEQLKIDSMPQAIVLASGIFATAGLVGFLIWSGWSAEAIIGFATLGMGLFVGQFAAARKASQLDAKQDQQSAKLDKVVKQTNGDMRAAIAEGVSRGIAAGLAVQEQKKPPWMDGSR
jgi:hypothetical protein